MTLYESILCSIIEIPNHLKMQEMCIEPVCMEPHSLACVLDHFRTQEIYNEAVVGNPYMLRYIPD